MSLEAAAEAEVEAVAASEASATCHREAAWGRIRPFRVWAECPPGAAWEAGL